MDGAVIVLCVLPDAPRFGYCFSPRRRGQRDLVLWICQERESKFLLARLENREAEKMGKARAIEEKKQRTMGKTQKLKISKSPRPTKKTLSPPQSPDPAKHYGLTRVLDAPVKLANAENKEFVFQYDVKFTDGLTCGGEQRKNERERERELREIFFLLDVEIARNFFFFFFFFFSLARAVPLLSLFPSSKNNNKKQPKQQKHQAPTPSSSPTSTRASRPRTSSTRRPSRSCSARTSAARPTRST